MMLPISVSHLQIPIAEGAATTLQGFAKSMFADFVHGQDGFGNTNQPSVKVMLDITMPPLMHLPGTQLQTTAI